MECTMGTNKAGNKATRKSLPNLPGQYSRPGSPVRKTTTYFTSGESQCGDRLAKTETESDLIREHQKRLSTKGNAAKTAKAKPTEGEAAKIDECRERFKDIASKIALYVFGADPNKPGEAKRRDRGKVKAYLSANPRRNN